MDNIYLKVTFDFIHVMATIIWFGSMFSFFALVKPAMENLLDSAQQDEFMMKLMSKLKIVVYISFALLFITGIPMKIANDNYVSIINFSNNWQITSFIKHVFVALLGLLTLYNFEVYPRLFKKVILENNPVKKEKLRNLKALSGRLSMVISVIVILLSAIMKYIE